MAFEVFSFTLRKLRTEYCNTTKPTLRIVFDFQRQFLPKLVTVYMPSTLIVCITFVSFWIDNQAVPGRVALLITATLTLIQLLISSRKDLPPVSYLTALDVWLFTCLLFVSFALFEFAISYTRTQKVNGLSCVLFKLATIL